MSAVIYRETESEIKVALKMMGLGKGGGMELTLCVGWERWEMIAKGSRWKGGGGQRINCGREREKAVVGFCDL